MAARTVASKFSTLSRRRLLAERLEQRLCFSAVRIVSWNTANSPNNSTEDAYYATVFEAIGSEQVVGNTLPPSIVSLQETDTAIQDGASISRIEDLLNSLYPQSRFDHAASDLDTGGDATGFVYDTAIFELVSTSIVAETPGMRSFAHRITRGQFRPVGSNGQSDFYLYTTHLKAGSGSDEKNRRAAEADAIRADIDALGVGQDVLVMGDFNISGSSEQAYRNFLASGVGQLNDPIDSPGEWKNDSRYKSIHTQNPAINGAGGMDDRFDFQLATSAVFDDEGLQFIEGSYHAFGNNGTHQFNSDITTGTGAAPNVLAALAAASDHLPVVVDYEINVVLPGITIDPTGTLSLTEGESSATYSVVLNTIPNDNVTVSITTDGVTQVNGRDAVTLTFTPADALTPQIVNVSAMDDSIAEGTVQSSINHTITSDDPQYQSVADVVVDVEVLDNDTPTVVISEIMYDSASNEPLGEWVELANLGPGNVDLSGWKLDDEDTLDWSAIPTIPLIPEGGTVIIHNNQIDSETFRDRWAIPLSTAVVGVTWGSLSNSPSSTNEILELLDAGSMVQDVVNFEDGRNSWPARNNASSIYLTDLRADNNNGSQWSRTESGDDGARHPSGSPFHIVDLGSPGYAPGLVLTPPQVIETQLAGEQRSIIRSLTVVFDRIVSAQATAFELHRLGVTSDLPTTVEFFASAKDVIDHTEIRLDFSGELTEDSGSLIDGEYQLTILATQVTSGGIALDGDHDGNAGGDYLFGATQADRFYRLFGDSDGDHDVDATDFRQFGTALSPSNYLPEFDFDQDGDIDQLDLGQFRRRLNRRLG
ncbi:lamin tail domain-containing protein [Rhodopirellula sp. MGV]|uniref:lamin tail domain-containing protein n=1 Tax=Rhodopirellula sp. MGV TaxID=2023130 RepID=UPI000B95DF30|nr:lamin tail domain-containing protein [Rhodopirellula sp. MGV]OYP38229.1 hypothetical protein CGZ80_03145 [Rhodopirellula sp. MGV]PNY38564.1 hypothetical protein C2E31_01190 [Rhodopirellula baltica]